MASHPKTLREIAGASPVPAVLSESALIIIDAQNEYRDGRLPLDGFDAAVAEIRRLLARARTARTPVIHVRHVVAAGSPVFAAGSRGAEIVDELEPLPDEVVVTKALPSSFTGTTLEQSLRTAGRGQLVVTGFMTHMCVSSTVREAAEKGWRCTVVAAACATRDLPSGATEESRGDERDVIPAAALHAAHLAALGDRFAVIVERQDAVAD
ncbi:cysteine hydrolase [Termitidicoccus mucosus]|uniref:Isochorismatase-like domain-containing protein n=1 Tax=Termitidicoccus mucosus TaxID=1184151 RepID=A0A178ICG3_9BACT|nr:hypothetical protein AW736_21845 [Opitutaceae bacterium TSB47]